MVVRVFVAGMHVVMIGMRLGGFARMVLGMRMVGMREMRMMAGVLVVAVIVMAGGAAMMLGGFLVMGGGVCVMFGGAGGVHGRSPWREQAQDVAQALHSQRP